MAANWEEFGSTRLNDKYYIDTSSIDNSGPYSKGWVKRIVKKSKTSKPEDTQKSIMLYEMSCASKQYRAISGVFYLFDGSIHRESNITDWAYIVPDSISDTIMQKVCN